MERPIKSASSWRRSGDTEREREVTEDDLSSIEDWADMVDSATARLCAGLQLNLTNAASPGTDTEKEVADFIDRYALTPGGNVVYKNIVHQAAGKHTCIPRLLFILHT